jgi:hypothetical protein
MKRWRYVFPLLDDRAKGEDLVTHLRTMFEPQRDPAGGLTRFQAGLADVASDPTLWVLLDYRGEMAEEPPDWVAHDIADQIRSRGLQRPGPEPAFRRLVDVPDDDDVVIEVPPGELRMDTGKLSLWMDPADASPEVVADVLRALSDLHVAAGGSGLHYTVDEDGSLIVAPAEELV